MYRNYFLFCLINRMQYLSGFLSHLHLKMKIPKEFRNTSSQTPLLVETYYHQDLKIKMNYESWYMIVSSPIAQVHSKHRKSHLVVIHKISTFLVSFRFYNQTALKKYNQNRHKLQRENNWEVRLAAVLFTFQSGVRGRMDWAFV